MSQLTYVSAILNFQEARGRPLEYYVIPLNDFITASDCPVVVFLDDKVIYDKISSKAIRVPVNYNSISNFTFELEWKDKFLKYFNNDNIWYNLTRTYLLKPKLLKLALNYAESSRYVWIDAGFPCSHMFNHQYNLYKNIYTESNIQYINEIFSKNRFLSQGWIVGQQNGVNMQIIYDALKLLPDGREHVTGCFFAIEKELIAKFNTDFFDTLSLFNKMGFTGTEENVFITMLSVDKNYCDFLAGYQAFTDKLRP